MVFVRHFKRCRFHWQPIKAKSSAVVAVVSFSLNITHHTDENFVFEILIPSERHDFLCVCMCVMKHSNGILVSSIFNSNCNLYRRQRSSETGKIECECILNSVAFVTSIL